MEPCCNHFGAKVEQGKLILWSTDIFDKKAKIIVPPGVSVIVLRYYRLIYPLYPSVPWCGQKSVHFLSRSPWVYIEVSYINIVCNLKNYFWLWLWWNKGYYIFLGQLRWFLSCIVKKSFKNGPPLHMLSEQMWEER